MMQLMHLSVTRGLRTRGPSRPGPAAIKPDGFMQFADAVQMDIFYVRDIRASNYMFPGYH